MKQDAAATAPANQTRDGACLNCGVALGGPFCSHCGQRAMAPYPTLREMVGDTWHELSGYDGRFARTFLLLLRRPGALTLELLAGRRARFIPPVRLYLVASLVYFVLAAAIPNVQRPRPAQLPGSTFTFDPMNPASRGLSDLPAQGREEVLKSVARAPMLIQLILKPILLDPASFRRGFLDVLARVLFFLVPVFAGIVALFYRRRPFSQHLLFALHLHAAIFLALMIRELSNLTRAPVVVGIFGVAALAWIGGYALLAFHRVYRQSWLTVVAKSLGIAVLYLVAGLGGLIVALLWAAMSIGSGS
ncbi:MAG: DUF3667 domain-containing protein [Vicinamibacterales bacterium]